MHRAGKSGKGRGHGLRRCMGLRGMVCRSAGNINRIIKGRSSINQYKYSCQQQSSKEQKIEQLRTIAVIDKEKCRGCGVCIDICEQEAITLNDIAIINALKCNGCGACTQECLNEAIELKKLENQS